MAWRRRTDGRRITTHDCPGNGLLLLLLPHPQHQAPQKPKTQRNKRMDAHLGPIFVLPFVSSFLSFLGFPASPTQARQEASASSFLGINCQHVWLRRLGLRDEPTDRTRLNSVLGRKGCINELIWVALCQKEKLSLFDVWRGNGLLCGGLVSPWESNNPEHPPSPSFSCVHAANCQSCS